jgi:hypothetical protein
MPDITARDLLGSIDLGLTVEALLKELDEVFPEQSPQYNESIEKLKWRGGQRDVVRWIRSRLQEENQSNGEI